MSQGMKRLATLLVALGVVLIGCAPAAQPAAQPTAAAPAASGEVKVWTEFTAGGEALGLDEIVKAWDAKNTGITINHRPIGNEEFFTVVRTGLAGGEPPDLLQFEGYQQTRDFAAGGQLADLSDWWAQNKGRFDVEDAGCKACQVDGKMYCIPMTFATGWQIYYNPDLLAANGIEVPKNWEEFLAACEKLKKAGITPIALGNKDGWPGEHWWMNFLVQRVGVETIYKAINREGAKFTDAGFVQAAADLQSLAKNGYLSLGAASDDYGAAQAIFLSGKAAFFQTGSWFAGGWETQKPAFTPGIMPFPAFSDNPNPGNVTGAVTHVIAVPAKAPNKAAAIKFLDYLFSDEAAAIWAKNGNISMNTGAVDKDAPQVIKDLWAGAKSAGAALPWIENELPPGVGEDKIYNGTVGLVSQTMTPEEFAKSIQDALEAAK